MKNLIEKITEGVTLAAAIGLAGFAIYSGFSKNSERKHILHNYNGVRIERAYLGQSVSRYAEDDRKNPSYPQLKTLDPNDLRELYIEINGSTQVHSKVKRPNWPKKK